MNVQFPIRKSDGSHYTNADELLTVLAAEKGGHYLLGAYNCWHGGIHISDASAPQCVQHEPVRCIADGEVVAYRLNQDYLTSTFAGTAETNTLQYSSSFCLVRHHYQSPTNTSEGPDQGKTNQLTFYSLYMHLAPYAAYTPSAHATIHQFVETRRALNARHPEGFAVLGLLERAAQLKILEKRVRTIGGQDYDFARVEIVIGEASRRESGQATRLTAKAGDEVWIALGKTNGQSYVKDITPPPRQQPGYWQGEVVATTHHRDYARHRPQGNTAHKIGLLTINSVFRYHTSTVQPFNADGTNQLLAECNLISGSLWDSGRPLDLPFWTGIEDRFVNRKPVVPTEFNSVVSCQVPIKAGDPIGYMGLYESPGSLAGDKDSTYQIHMEVFSCDADIDGFLKNLAGLTDGKQYLQIASGKQLYSKGGTDAAPTFHPQGRPTNQEFIVDFSEVSQHQEADGNEWFGVTLPQGSTSLAGFIAKDDVHRITSHDREKLGFKIVKEENENADGFIDTEQMPEFFRQLHRDIDAKGTADGKVSIAEMQAAQRDPVLRQRWGKLIAYHPTEWQAKSDQPKWQRLHDLMEESPELLRHECERIDNLVFWDVITEASAALPNRIYHFNPILLIENINQNNNFRFTTAMMAKIYPEVAISKKSELTEIARELNKHIEFYKLDTPLRRSHFFAQIMQETGSSLSTEENFVWKADSLKRTFKYFRDNPSQADRHGYEINRPIKSDGSRMNQSDFEAIANGAYGGRVGNGSHSSGDGWLYRGRGLKQLTGRGNYRAFTLWHIRNIAEWPDEDLDFENNPDLLTQIKYAVRSAAFFWVTNGLHVQADLGPTSQTVEKITDIVNFHTDSNSRNKRINNFQSIWHNNYFI